MATLSTDIHLPEELLTKAFRETYKDSTLSVAKVTVRKPSSSTGDHFGSYVDFLDVELEGKSNVMQLFVKSIPASSTGDDNDIDRKNFMKEVAFFKTIVPALRKFCRVNARNPVDLSFLPVCCYAESSPQRNVIALENVTSRGYQVMPTNAGGYPHDDHHVKMVIQTMATLHAVSYSLRLSTGKSLLESFPSLRENLFCDEMRDTFGVYHDQFYTKCLAVLEGEPQYREQLDMLQEIGLNLFEVTSKLLTEEGPFSVITHGDVWNANCMFRHDDGKPTSMILVDYQLPRCSHLVSDISYYLFMSTSRIYRKDNFLQVLQCYRDRFVSVAKSFDVPQIPFTTKELVREFDTVRQYWVAFAVQTITYNNSYTQEEFRELPNSNREIFLKMPSILEKILQREDFRKHMKEALLELYEEILWIKAAGQSDDD